MGTDACAWRVCEIWFGGAATTPKGDSWRRLRRKPKTATDAAPEAAAAVGPRSPTVYDWVVISSLDRWTIARSSVVKKFWKILKNKITNRAEEYLWQRKLASWRAWGLTHPLCLMNLCLCLESVCLCVRWSLAMRAVFFFFLCNYAPTPIDHWNIKY